jgi:hypothetical protein
VTRHDGTTPHHLIGIIPDVPLEPTSAGIRRGRDELLEKAVALIDRARPPVPAAQQRVRAAQRAPTPIVAP